MMPRTQYLIVELGTAHKIAFSPSEDRAAFIGNRDTSVLDLSTRKRLFSRQAIAHPSYLEFSPDGRRLVLKSTSGRVVILDAESGRTVRDFHNQKDGEGSAALFSICGHYVITVSWGGLLSVRDSATTEQVFAYTQHGCVLDHLSAPADRRFFICSVGKPPKSDAEPPPPDKVLVYPWPFRENGYRELSRAWSFICAMNVSPSGRFVGLIHGAPPETLEIYDIDHSEVLVTRHVSFGGTGCSLGWSADERLLAINGADRFRVLDTQDLPVKYEFPIRYPCFASFSPSCKFLALGSWQRSFVVLLDQLASFGKQ